MTNKFGMRNENVKLVLTFTLKWCRDVVYHVVFTWCIMVVIYTWMVEKQLGSRVVLGACMHVVDDVL